jgi:hypothetical protein
MNVVKFPPLTRQAPEGWQSAELQQFLAVSSGAIAAGEASGWDDVRFQGKADIIQQCTARVRFRADGVEVISWKKRNDRND